VSRQPGFDGELDYFFIQYRQDAGKAATNWTGMCVGFTAELRRASTKDL